MIAQNFLCEFFYSINPIAKERARIVFKGKRSFAFTPKKTEQFERNIRYLTLKAMQQLKLSKISKPLSIELLFFEKPPSSWSKKKIDLALRTRELVPLKKDGDNLEKAFADGLVKALIDNDNIIIDCNRYKVYGEEEGILFAASATLSDYPLWHNQLERINRCRIKNLELIKNHLQI
jgi:Holliday junction resolvase RusA-like endonuclease